jgi:hypothetical protein
MTEPAKGVGFLAEPSNHTVVTTHIQRLLLEASTIAQACDGVVADGTAMDMDGRPVLVHMALDRAANLLRHAAEELQDERFLALGWPAV